MISNIQSIAQKLWGTVVTGGIVSIIFGLVAMLWPHITLSFFIYLFSIFVLLVSVVVLGQAFTNIRVDRLWWLSMLFAVCGISIGLFILVNPQVAQAFLAVLLAVYIFSQSLMDLVMASYSDNADKNTRWPIIAVGILGIIFGFVVLLYPQLATETMVWVIGLYILAHGLIVEYYAFRLRRQVKQLAQAIADDSANIEPDQPKPKRKSSRRKSSNKKSEK